MTKEAMAPMLSNDSRACSLAARAWITAGLVIGMLGCSADLHELAGPIVPLPNLTGTVLRDGQPVAGIKVKLEDTTLDQEVNDDRTSAAGIFAFSGVGAGTWTVRVDGVVDGDFDKVSYDLEFASAETSLVCPDLEISLSGLVILEPESGMKRSRPGLFSPLTFQWTDPQGEARSKQVRLYRDEDGAPFWFSSRLTDEQVRWNGLGNQGANTGQAAPAGRYRWRLAVEPEDGDAPLQYTTRYLNIEFEE